MNYYKRHIGDYAKKAGHLSILEHGVYTLLMDAYYDREQAPTRQEAVRISRARSADELAALDAVLADFFTETDGRYVQARIEQEFVLAEIQAEKNKANGKQGGRPRKPKGQIKESESKAKITQSVILDNPSESEKNPNPLIHQSTNPLTEDQKTIAPLAQTPKENLRLKLQEMDLPHCIPRQSWQDFVSHRCEIRKPMTERAARSMAKEMQKLHNDGEDITELIETSIRNGWQSLVVRKGNYHANNNSNGSKSSVVERVAAKVAALERNTGCLEGQAITVIAR